MRLLRLIHARNDLLFRRSLVTTANPLCTRFDPKIFVEPIVDIETLRRGEFDKEDPRNFLHSKPMLFNDSPVFYRDHIVDKMVNVCLRRGQKELAQQLIYEALEIVKRRQYKKHRLRKEDDEPVELDPFVIANKAIRNCRPLMKLLNVTRGGVTYRVPFPIPAPEAEFRAMKMMREACRLKSKGGNMTFEEALANEFILAARNEGTTIKEKQEHHKLCDANRAFAHYRK